MNITPYKTIDRCRLCGSRELISVLNLGTQYVNDFPPVGEHLNGVKCPIELVLCSQCTLVQMRDTAPQSILYSRFYWYRSGVTATMRAALRDVVDSARRYVSLEPGDVVLDVGCNDGTLLKSYEGRDVLRVGVDPADNLAAEAADAADVFIHDFWSEDAYRAEMGDRNAEIVTACGMFYDLDDPNAFVRDVAAVLAEDGVFVAQLMCLRNMIDSKDVGNLSHEHLEFYSLQSLYRLLGKHGLGVFDIEQNAVNGGSYRLYCCHLTDPSDRMVAVKGRDDVRDRFKLLEDKEFELADPAFYQGFYRELERNRCRTHGFLTRARQFGKRTWIYGASTKGNVILQYYGLGDDLIQGASDRSPEKWGRCTVGTGIPIYSEEEARKANPDYFLVLPYAFIEEFKERERDWYKGGDRFIVPLPEFHLV